MRRLRVLVLLWALAIPSLAGAQRIQPMASGNVKVTPDGGTALVVGTSSTLAPATFQVQNNNNSTQEYELSCGHTGKVTDCYVDLETVSIGAYQTVPVTVFYGTATTSGSGTVTLRADGVLWDTGYRNVSVVTPTAPSVALVPHSDSTWDRRHCLVLAAGSQALQCGDLVVAHALPGYATLGTERALGLVYTSAQAVPRPAVAARISAPTVTWGLSAIWVGLKVNGTWRDSARYAPWTSGARQVVLAFDATPLATGAYPFQLEVRAVYGGGSYATTRSGTLAVVNRASSPYGQGWQLAGVEELILNQPAGTGAGILRVTSEGSALLYAPDPQDGDRWIAPAGAYRDTIVSVGDTAWVRTLRHGVQVGYDLQGRHLWTTNRAGFTTAFRWTGTRLTSVVVPPVDSSATTYVLSYDGGGQLTGITDPAGRTLGATVTGGRLVALTDPDALGVSFSYDPAGRLVRRTDRRGYGTRFAYGKGLRVTEVRVPVGTGADSAVTTHTAWDEQGLATGYLGQVAVDTATVRTRLFGPRQGVADDATFVVDRWGAPTRITDPLGAVTRLERGDPARPALVTKVTAPNGRETRLAWNTRGNLTEERVVTAGLPDAQPDLVTRYTYHDATTPDAPDSVIAPGNVVTRYAYTAWGGLDRVTAPNTHVTEFRYVTTGPLTHLLREVRELQVPAWDSVQQRAVLQSALRHRFGMNALGNVVADTSPMGRVRVRAYDAAQRVTDTWDPAGHHVSYEYDVLNRVRQVREHLEEVAGSGYAAPLVTEYLYGTDLLDTIVDPRDVRRTYRYDAAGRLIAEGDEAGVEEVYTLDHAGLVTSALTRRGATITQAWDAAGQRTRTSWTPLDGFAGDTLDFTYDAMGQLLTAAGEGPAVARTYYPTGALKRDSSLVVHDYGYDAAGRQAWHRMGHPGALSRDSVIYRYSPAGALATIAVRWWSQAQASDSVRFTWDALGRRDRLYYSNGAEVGHIYDADGMLRVLCGAHASGNTAPHDNVFQFAVVHQAVDLDGAILVTTTAAPAVPGCGGSAFHDLQLGQVNTYDARHQLTRQVIGAADWQYAYDASGNRTAHNHNGEPWAYTYGTHSNRLLTKENGVGSQCGAWWCTPVGYVWDFLYNADGSRATEHPCNSPSVTCGSAPVQGLRTYKYDARGRTRQTSEVGCDAWDPVSGACSSLGLAATADCGYDPLSRLVMSCEDGGPWLGYEGEQVVRTNPQAVAYFWTFVPGPGTDAPVLGRYTQNQTYGKTYFIVTDGMGKQYALGSAAGHDGADDEEYLNHGGRYSGAGEVATGYGSQRFPNASQPGLAFFRNRFYDQQTGRWTQEDPLGAAGGVNLYQFNGNNPVRWTDPFGLRPDTVEVGCRPLDGVLGVVGNHCALRVGENEDKQAGELLRTPNGLNHVVTFAGTGAQAEDYTWTVIPVPEGQTSAEFDQTIIRSFNTQSVGRHGREYSSHGRVNSNQFIFAVITAAGGVIPAAASPSWGVTPGLCGGGPGRFELGDRCSP